MRGWRPHSACQLGARASAIDRLDRAINYCQEMGSTGLNLGWGYEVRARVAIWMRDQGLQIDELRTGRRSLEEVFLRLTSEDVDQ